MFKKMIKLLLGETQVSTSKEDKFLQRIREKYPKLSISQEKEIADHEQIVRMRDGNVKLETKKSGKLWDGF